MSARVAGGFVDHHVVISLLEFETFLHEFETRNNVSITIQNMSSAFRKGATNKRMIQTQND